MEDTIYSAIDSRGQVWFERPSLIALEQAFVEWHWDGNLRQEPDIAQIIRYDEDADEETVLPKALTENFLKAIASRCEYEPLPVDGMTAAKARDGY